VIQLFHEQAFAADGVEHLEEQGPGLTFPAGLRDAPQSSTWPASPGESSHKASFAICATVSADGLWVLRFRGQETEHGVMMDNVAPHGCCLPMMHGPGLKHQERENALHIGG
jgi:hypothetical protein